MNRFPKEERAVRPQRLIHVVESQHRYLKQLQLRHDSLVLYSSFDPVCRNRRVDIGASSSLVQLDVPYASCSPFFFELFELPRSSLSIGDDASLDEPFNNPESPLECPFEFFSFPVHRRVLKLGMK